MKNKEILEQHEQFCKIWHATDGRYKTKLPDESKPNGKKIIAKTCRKDLEKCIIKYYKGIQEQKENPRTMKALYPEWLKYKAVDTSKANATNLQWVWNTYYADSEIVNMDISSIDVIIIKEWFLKVIKKYELSSRKYKEMKFLAIQKQKWGNLSKIKVSHTFNQCGRWDLNPHDLMVTRSLVLLVCQFRHFRICIGYVLSMPRKI